MLLVRQEIGGRAFLLQFLEVMQEFGHLIPWLCKAESARFVTNGACFKEELCRAIGCAQDNIVPYQLVSSDRAREFVGGVIHFTVSPERFSDPTLASLCRNLSTRGAAYISCLQVRHVKRGVAGHGNEIVLRAINRILQTYPEVWGVCEPRLVPWYASLGAKILNNGDNAERLAVVAWKLEE